MNYPVKNVHLLFTSELSVEKNTTFAVNITPMNSKKDIENESRKTLVSALSFNYGYCFKHSFLLSENSSF